MSQARHITKPPSFVWTARIIAEAYDNPLVHLAVVGETGHPGLTRAHVKMYATSPDPEPVLRAAWTEAIERSPLACTLRGCVDLSLELHLVD